MKVRKSKYNRINSIEVRKGKSKLLHKNIETKVKSTTLDRVKPKISPLLERETQKDKIHPDVRSFIMNGQEDKTKECLVVLKRKNEIPKFARLNSNDSNKSNFNKEVVKHNRALSKKLAKESLKTQSRFADKLNINIEKSFWVNNSFKAKLTKEQIIELAAMKEVQYVDSNRRNSHKRPTIKLKSHSQSGVRFTLENARQLLNTDQFYHNQGSHGHVAILDTGVDVYHELLQFRNIENLIYDASGEGAYRVNSGVFAADAIGHGTSTASIICGNDRWLLENKGLTSCSLTSYDVFDMNDNEYLAEAVSLAIILCIESGVSTIAVNLDGEGSYLDSISTAADTAMNAGYVVLGANGNHRDVPGLVSSPANARGALGIGAYDGYTRLQDTNQSVGPTSDNRIKPEFRCPTGAYAADTKLFNMNQSTHQRMHDFDATSGALPFAAGMSVIAENIFSSNSLVADPGSIYTFLLACCDRGDNSISNNSGLGDILFPNHFILHSSKTRMDSLDTQIIDFKIRGHNTRKLIAAIWWCSPVQYDNPDIDLSLLNPNGNEVKESNLLYSSFEHVIYDNNNITGVWKIQISPYILTAAVDVYWTVLEIV